MSLGPTVECEEAAYAAAKGEKIEERIKKDVRDWLCLNPRITKRELVAVVTGNDATKLRVIDKMVERGEVLAEQDRRATRYRLAEIQVEGGQIQ